MEQNVPVTAKRVWSIVKAILFMMRKGMVSKRKLMLDLNIILKRGKTAIGNLMSHHSNNNNNNRQLATYHATEATASANEYEFSCSNTPNYIFPFNLVTKKKNNYYNNLFTCTHAPPTLDDDNMATAVKVALEILNNNSSSNVVGASPMLPGFGQTPLARQLRITDSPFPLRDVDGDDDVVDKAAEDFINRFYKDLKQQNKKMANL